MAALWMLYSSSPIKANICSFFMGIKSLHPCFIASCSYCDPDVQFSAWFFCWQPQLIMHCTMYCDVIEVLTDKSFKHQWMFIRKGERKTCGTTDWWASPLCLGEDHRTDPTGRHVKAHEGQSSDLRQPRWLRQGKVMPNKAGGLLW